MAVRVIIEDELPWKSGSRFEKDGVELRTRSRYPIAAFEETGPFFGNAPGTTPAWRSRRTGIRATRFST